MAVPPASHTWATASLAASSSMSATTMLAPSSANRRADALPIPLPAPVMIAVFPASRMGAPFLSGCLRRQEGRLRMRLHLRHEFVQQPDGVDGVVDVERAHRRVRVPAREPEHPGRD